jgi:aminoglycoside phosphotransferase (APT) family kinase protein
LFTRSVGEEVVRERSQEGGYTPAVASLLTTASGRSLFCKAMPQDHPLCPTLDNEAAVASAVPEGVPVPRLVWEGAVKGWRVVVCTAVLGRHVDLSPDSDDVGAVISSLDALAGALTPSPVASSPTARQVLGPVLHGWSVLGENPSGALDPWAVANLERLRASETLWIRYAEGDTLVHGDIRADQLLIDAGRRVWVVDWAHPCRGAAWIDAVELVPHLIMAGNTPCSAEKRVAVSARFCSAPAEAVDSFAVAAAGYWARACRQEPPPGPGGARLRAFQAQAAEGPPGGGRDREGGGGQGETGAGP